MNGPGNGWYVTDADRIQQAKSDRKRFAVRADLGFVELEPQDNFSIGDETDGMEE